MILVVEDPGQGLAKDRQRLLEEVLTDWKNRVPQEDGDYIFTNLAEYDDLTPGRKIVEEALKKSGK